MLESWPLVNQLPNYMIKFSSFHFGIFVFLYFGHFSMRDFFKMCSACLFFLARLALQDKQKIPQYFRIFVTSLTKTKNAKWNEINKKYIK